MSRVCLLALAALLTCARASEDPEGKPAAIADDENAAIADDRNATTAVTGELGKPLHVRCLESQDPTLYVAWYRGPGKAMFLRTDSVYAMTRNALLIRSLAIETLGQYTCQAHNSEGVEAPRKIEVRAYIPDLEPAIKNKCLRPTVSVYQPQNTVSSGPETTTISTSSTTDALDKLEVAAFESGTAILRCLFNNTKLHSDPPPNITWKLGELKIDGNTGRYRLTSEGALEIVSLHRNDTGVYICVANNGLGNATQEIHLIVKDAVRMPVGIAGDENVVVTGELGQPVHVRCLAYGYPPPAVFWYRGYEDEMVLYNDAIYEVTEHFLLIRNLSIETLGSYSCRAYNGAGKPVSWGVVVKAYSPHDTEAPRPMTQWFTTDIWLSSEIAITPELTEISKETTETTLEASKGSTTSEGTTDIVGTTTLDPCSGFQFGCCADNETEASRPDGQGCPCNATSVLDNGGCRGPCSTSPHGCCQDGKTPAHGPEFEGCCFLQAFGCCPDNRKPADGPHYEGCGCQSALHGCCPDNVTIAQGPENQGCGCQYTQHGCCLDRHTTAAGPNNEGCACNTYQFGCCSDGITIAKGPEQQGCHCRDSKFGCCGDDETPATGPDAAGCDCSSSRHGCCPDGRTEAAGPKFFGCTDAPKNKQAACSMSTDPGPCKNFTPIWYYDLAYGGCSRFWYGGCDGNGNRFATKEDCEEVCVQPSPKDACKLPSVQGACDADYQRWHYNSKQDQCIPFRYGGCLGNANNFATRELCQKQCEPTSTSVADQCSLPIDQGSCAGNYSHWGFNTEAHRCEQFIWGGCEGNSNRFGSKAACQMLCTGTQPLQCTQPQEAGNCSGKEALWSFSQSENRCVPFYYSGCGGNDNRFGSREACEQTCPSAYVPDKCTLPAETGQCSNYRERWFYHTTWKRCGQFYYGGCGGNENNFATEAECDNSCAEIETTTTTPTTTARPVAPQPQTQRLDEPEPGPLEQEKSEFCFNAIDAGPCNKNETRYAYDSELGCCVTFQYGGCGGNRNNFPDKAYCSYYCQPMQDSDDVIPKDCTLYQQECDALECQFGVDRFAKDGCPRCICIEDPCNTANCASNERCEAVAIRDFDSQEPVYSARCVTESNDVYQCYDYVANCSRLRCEWRIQRSRQLDGCEKCECVQVEIDCEPLKQECNELKCNYGIKRTIGSYGCERCNCKVSPCQRRSCAEGEQCVVQYVNGHGPAQQLVAECRTRNVPAAPQTLESEVVATEGSTATLRCRFHGNSSTKIKWRFGELTIDGNADRYRLTSDGLD